MRWTHCAARGAGRGVLALATLLFPRRSARSVTARGTTVLQCFFAVLPPWRRCRFAIFQSFRVCVFLVVCACPRAARTDRETVFIDRFSRIYPLHLATFVVVAVLQKIYSAYTGNAFVYPFNDAYHALLNVLLAPAWGFEDGWSFNGPVWSVSVEVLLYGAFFLLWRYAPAPLVISVGLVVSAAWIFPAHYKIALGVIGFFGGGLAYFGVAALLRRFAERWVGVSLTLVCATGWWLFDDANQSATDQICRTVSAVRRLRGGLSLMAGTVGQASVLARRHQLRHLFTAFSAANFCGVAGRQILQWARGV
jgi:peptidoglycan/LPS O-acetylase OafA/YrhL